MPFHAFRIWGLRVLGAIAPERCQPFDKNRKGMVPGEGAGMLVLEPLDTALARNAKIYAEVLGYGVSCDAHHMTAAHPEADGAIRAMSAAMKESGVGINDIDYLSAHGTGTPTNDRIESLGRAEALFRRARSEDSDEFHQINARTYHGRGECNRRQSRAHFGNWTRAGFRRPLITRNRTPIAGLT